MKSESEYRFDLILKITYAEIFDEAFFAKIIGRLKI